MTIARAIARSVFLKALTRNSPSTLTESIHAVSFAGLWGRQALATPADSYFTRALLTLFECANQCDRHFI